MKRPALFRHLAWPPGRPELGLLLIVLKSLGRPDPSRKSTAQTPVIATQEEPHDRRQYRC